MRKNSKFIMIAILFLAVIAFVGQPIMSVIGKRESVNMATEAQKKPATTLVFNADSAYSYAAAQCDFGPRTMNSEAHDKCEEWIATKFESFGLTVERQKAVLKGYDGTPLRSTNIIASLNPNVTNRILLCAHWDSRPWADNDPNPDNHRKPVMAANDGASGVAVMIELARILKADSAMSNIGVDFVCFDAEDWGTPQWETSQSGEDTWALGSKHWAEEYVKSGKNSEISYKFGILLDMVGGFGARFYQEGMSLHYAPEIVNKVWQAARTAGYGSHFPNAAGGYITDDHVPVNQIAGIKCIDIIPYYPDCKESSFGPTWHTINDTMENIDRTTLKAVGQTVAQTLSEE